MKWIIIDWNSLHSAPDREAQKSYVMSEPEPAGFNNVRNKLDKDTPV